MALPASGFVVLGAGGHGRVVADLIRALGHEVTGYADANAEKLGCQVDARGAQVLLAEDHVLACVEGRAPWPFPVDALALGIGDNAARDRVRLRLPRELLPPLVHPTAWVSDSATVGAGAVVLPGAVIHTQAIVGDAAIINSRSVVEHDCRVGAAAHVSPGAVLCGGVIVGERSWIAAAAVIIPYLTVGDDSVVGAGAVVIRNVSDGTTVVGNPARATPHGDRRSIESRPSQRGRR